MECILRGIVLLHNWETQHHPGHCAVRVFPALPAVALAPLHVQVLLESHVALGCLCSGIASLWLARQNALAHACLVGHPVWFCPDEVQGKHVDESHPEVTWCGALGQGPHGASLTSAGDLRLTCC